ncbi:MAG TPA: hypothetical protein DCQ98_19035 [Planctomycetaceae bacterium]|nr:hypothetical protein [Planctomycetaceae bacterium]
MPFAPLRRAWLLLLLIAIGGCDLGTYGARYQERRGTLETRARRAAHLHSAYQRLDDAAGNSLGAQIRLPKLFDGDSRRLSPTQAETMPQQAVPPGMPLPLSYTYERYVSSGDDQLPIYVYVGSFPMAEGEAEGLEARLDALVAAVITDAPRWAEVPYESLDGEAVTFRSLKISAAQPFMVIDPSGKAESRTLEGQLFFHLKQVGDKLILVGLRYPSQIADAIGFPEGMEASLGSFRPL